MRDSFIIQSPRIHRFRKRLLLNQTETEKIAFSILHKYRFKVEKQKMFWGENRKRYFIDLWLPHYALGIELDGEIHQNQIDYDLERDVSIMRVSPIIALIRFSNNDILKRKEFFIRTIYEMILKRIYFLNCFKVGRIMLDKADKYHENLSQKHRNFYRFANLPILYNGNNLLDWWEDNYDGFDMN